MAGLINKDAPPPACSVVIPVRYGLETLPALLKALARQTLPVEAIVVDNGQDPETVAIAQAHGARWVSVPATRPSVARNAGAKLARGDVLLFTDADCEPDEHWAERASAPVRAGDVIGTRGAYRTRQRELVARFVQMEYQNKYERMMRFESIDMIDTYSACYRRDVFAENGGFDNTYTWGVEDQELSFRLTRLGHRLVFVPDALVYHTHQATLRGYLRRKYIIAFWKAFLLRNYPEKVLGDTHTPPRQPIQVGLMGLALALVPVALFVPAVWWAVAGLLVVLLLSAWPLYMTIARHDPPVLLVAPGMILLRALVMGFGLVFGAVGARPAEDVDVVSTG